MTNSSKLATVVLAVLVVITCNCGGALYKVKPAAQLPPLPSRAKTASAGGITIHAAPPLTDEETQQLFEANLPVSGVLALRVSLDYDGDVPVEMKKARFSLRDAKNLEWKLLKPKQATSRILKANGITAYNPNSRKRFEEEFSAYALDVTTPLTSSTGRREGFLFFQTPDGRAVESPTGLTLRLEKVPQPLELNLN